MRLEQNADYVPVPSPSTNAKCSWELLRTDSEMEPNCFSSSARMSPAQDVIHCLQAL